jgi:sec-independent protein translocase protein TatB
MFGVGPWELMAIVVVGLVIFGPERLPKMAADAARFLRDVRRMAASARQDLTEALGTELPDLDLGDLNPKAFLKGNVLDLLDDDSGAASGNGNGSAGRGPRGASGGPSNGSQPGSGRSRAAQSGSSTGDESDPPASASDQPTSYDADTT